MSGGFLPPVYIFSKLVHGLQFRKRGNRHLREMHSYQQAVTDVIPRPSSSTEDTFHSGSTFGSERARVRDRTHVPSTHCHMRANRFWQDAHGAMGKTHRSGKTSILLSFPAGHDLAAALHL